jgi:uncharacterized protein (TIGR03643 family)
LKQALNAAALYVTHRAREKAGGPAKQLSCQSMAKPVPRLSPQDVERIIATAWDDKPPFNQVLMQHGLSHGQVVQLLKRELTPSAFKLWASRSGALPGRPSRPGSQRPAAKAKR